MKSIWLVMTGDISCDNIGNLKLLQVEDTFSAAQLVAKANATEDACCYVFEMVGRYKKEVVWTPKIPETNIR